MRDPVPPRAALLWSMLICVFLAWITYHLKVATTPAWTDGTLELVHERLLASEYFNNEQSRLLQFGIPEAIHRTLGTDLRRSYALQRLIFTALALFLFFRYTRRWLDDAAAYAVTVLFALSIAFTARNDLQESAPLLACTFIGAVWAMREGRWWICAGITWLGAFNNETMLFIPVLIVLTGVHDRSLPHLAKVLGRATLVAAPAYLTVAAIRYATREHPYLGGGWHPMENLMALDSVLLFLGPFWILAFWRFKELPVFLQRSLLATPLFLLPNMLIGQIAETRLLLPLCFFVLPAALWTLLPTARRDQGSAA